MNQVAQRVLALALAGMSVVSCGGKSERVIDEVPRASSGFGGTGGNGTGGSVATTGGSDTSGGSGVGGSILMGGSGGSGGSGGVSWPGACATLQASSQRISRGVFVALDRSRSMAPFAMTTYAMLTDLFSNPYMTGIMLALRPFPDDPTGGSCNTQTCNFEECSSPLVDYGELLEAPAPEDAHEAALNAALSESSPGQDEAPLGAALAGALAAASARTMADPLNRSSVLLVTAGAPSACDADMTELIALARDAFDNQGIPTFVAVPASLQEASDLDLIAEAGGTGATFRVESDAEDLAHSFQPTRGSLACDLSVPDPPETTPVDFALTQFRASFDEVPMTLFPNAGNVASCGETLSWYFDDQDAPSRVLMCPWLCDAVTGARSSRVEVTFYCPAEPPRPD